MIIIINICCPYLVYTCFHYRSVMPFQLGLTMDQTFRSYRIPLMSLTMTLALMTSQLVAGNRALKSQTIGERSHLQSVDQSERLCMHAVHLSLSEFIRANHVPRKHYPFFQPNRNEQPRLCNKHVK